MSEETKPVLGYEGLYSVSKSGKVYSHRVLTNLKRNRRTHKKSFIVDPNSFIELKQSLKTRGYYVVTLYDQKGNRKYKYVHRLLAQAYIDNPHFLPEVNHKNGIKSDNSLDNLEWCTHRYNAIHAAKTGLFKCYGEENAVSKLKNIQRVEIYDLYNTGKLSFRQIGLIFGVHKSTTRQAYHFVRKKLENE